MQAEGHEDILSLDDKQRMIQSSLYTKCMLLFNRFFSPYPVFPGSPCADARAHWRPTALV